MNIKQKYHEYKLAQSEKAIVRQKLDDATLEISYSMDVQDYGNRMSNGMNLPKCINIVLIESGRESVIQKCGAFDKDLDCLECNNCRHYDKRKYYMELEKEFKIAQQKAKTARRDLINEIKNIFMLRR